MATFQQEAKRAQEEAVTKAKNDERFKFQQQLHAAQAEFAQQVCAPGGRCLCGALACHTSLFAAFLWSLTVLIFVAVVCCCCCLLFVVCCLLFVVCCLLLRSSSFG